MDRWLAKQRQAEGLLEGRVSSTTGEPLCKKELFKQEGMPLRELLVAGVDELDANLDGIRLDRYAR